MIQADGSVRAMLYPVFAMVVLTIAVWLRLYATRVAELKRERIHPQSVASAAQMATRLSDTRAADNFRNLFELPVLFYLALVVAVLTAQVTTAALVLAWSFVVLRVVHSWIHCSYNRVMHRFPVYLAGGVALWVLWALLAVGMLRT